MPCGSVNMSDKISHRGDKRTWKRKMLAEITPHTEAGIMPKTRNSERSLRGVCSHFQLPLTVKGQDRAYLLGSSLYTQQTCKSRDKDQVHYLLLSLSLFLNNRK